jgi:cyclohexa-1,5-dienecarbonyl-CoA hydratase
VIRCEHRHGGGHLRLVIDQPKGNILTIAVMRDLRQTLAETASATGIKLVTIEGAGEHFSYGASVEEHRPGAIDTALGELHALVGDLLAVPAPTACVVRGRCLGGAFELALACDFVFAATTAVLGSPEIALGVFPPVAAALLPLRVGASRATSAVITGQPLPAERWAEAGLIEMIAPPDEIADAVDRWFEANLAGRSAASLSVAAAATRVCTRQYVARVLPTLERLYLDRLMQTSDAVEGIEAFLEKRPPVWSHT